MSRVMSRDVGATVVVTAMIFDPTQEGRAGSTLTEDSVSPTLEAVHSDRGQRGTAEEGLMLKDFRAFLMRGNVVDLAVAVVLGTAFGAIVTSFVNDLLMPPVGLLLGRVDFSNLFVTLSHQNYPSVAAAKAAGAPTLNYGLFLNTIVN